MTNEEKLADAEANLISIELRLGEADVSDEERATLERRQKSLENAVKRLEKIIKADTQADKDENLVSRQESMTKFIADNEVYYLAQQNKYLAKLDDEYHLLSESAIDNYFPTPLVHGSKIDHGLLSQTCFQMERNRIDQCYTLGTPPKGYLNLFKSDLCPMVASEDYHYAFDALMYSLGGGLEENIQAIEMWLLARYNQIHFSIEDCTFPALVFNNRGGGSGKGLLTERIWIAMFGAKGVLPNMSMGELTSSHNDAILQKVCVHVNESAMEKTDTDALKRILGSPTLMVNPKFVKAFLIPNIMAFIISGNDFYKVVKLSNNKIDRRFSIVRSDLIFDEVIRLYAEKISGTEFTPAMVSELITKLVHEVFTNRHEVGRWLYCLNERYKQEGEPLKYVAAHHGKDYREASQLQLSLDDRLFERLFENLDAICSEMVWLAYKDNHNLEGGGYSKKKKSALIADFEAKAVARGFSVKKAYDQNNNRYLIFHAPSFDVGSSGSDIGLYDRKVWCKTIGEGKYESKVVL